jgi:serine/threonine protein kinase
LILGSLDKLLYDSKVKLSEERKIQLIRGIAAGMFHLHRHNIVHRDLAARNILLTGNGDPKISVLSLFCVSFPFDLIYFDHSFLFVVCVVLI